MSNLSANLISSDAQDAKVTIARLRAKRRKGENVTMLTAYDYPTARLVDAAGVDLVLVGDSLAMEELGHETTLPLALEEMLHHVKAVRRGTHRALLVADMPFLSYQVNDDEAVRNAGRLLAEGGAGAVKLEGGQNVAALVQRLTQIGIPVMGHIGFTPQSVNVLGWRVQGRTEESAERLKADALALQEAGAFGIVLELMPKMLAGEITQALTIPTIGIGSGPLCAGQVLVTSDLIGLRHDRATYRHVKRYADVSAIILDALTEFKHEVEQGAFPSDAQSFE
jgi:3-methyl-2-oxobutanoate hydroxymethyltransferase